MTDLLKFDLAGFMGGLFLFLFSMNTMNEALQSCSGNKLKVLLARLTDSRLMGFFTGLSITAIVQSSSAVTVAVVGFVNSGVLTLAQSVGVIMGANIGTTITPWILSLNDIENNASLILSIFKPDTFAPAAAIIGVILYTGTKSSRKKNTGLILLGFAGLMFGMKAMSAAVLPLGSSRAFLNMLTKVSEPGSGVLAGALLTGVIQSSSASVGILQALTKTGAVTYGAALPIIMGQNIGTCVTALISSVGAKCNGKRVAVVHFLFNIIGAGILLIALYIVRAAFAPAFLSKPADCVGVSTAHTAFNLICTAILFPLSSLLEKLAIKLVPDPSPSKIKIYAAKYKGL